ncbi:protease-4 [Sphingobium subterraneum]|uniref:Protease-4 n=2 Tax=Sphingobium subterraneum TaxID=627688 RepID=A0A841J5K4_9SPHN|nr:protease-4 [Sphingobium subterraneum]
MLVLLFLLLFFGFLYAALSFSTGERQARVTAGALLLDLNGTIVEQPSAEDPIAILSGNRAPLREYRLRDLVTSLEAARTDANVKAVVLNLDGFMGGGQVALSRVGRALDAVRAANKPVLAFATAYEDDGYQLAAHASEVWINPIGGVAISGPGGSQLYFKGLIDRLGITANIYRVGTYKSAVEPFLRPDMSPAAREANQALDNILWQNWRNEVGKARPRAQLAAYTADMLAAARVTGGNMAQAALNARLVDKVGDETAFAQRVAALSGQDDNPEGPGFAAIDLSHYVRAKTPSNNGPIGVLTIAGDIVDGEAGPGAAAGDSIALLLRKALAQNNLKALVIRVDSPGGSVLASEQIRTAIAQAKAQGLPVVTSMGNVAASGGYWVTTLSDTVFAEPSTITGSIGVFGILPSFEGTLAKIGITSDGVTTTPLSGEPNVLGGVSPEFNAIAQLGVEDMYRRFIGIVSQARKLSPARVDAIAQGRVWDGGTARKIGLIDRFGGLEDAIAEAARRAKIDPASARPTYIEQEPDRFTRFLEAMRDDNAENRAASGHDLLGRAAARQRLWALQAVSDARGMIDGPAVRASCLECIGHLPPAPKSPASDGIWEWMGKALAVLR